ncbi:MAG: nucleotide sugar dehydrogenase [Myxococcota bacterium]
MSELKQALLEKISSGTVHVGIIGMGYVGLPLALAFVERAKVKVTGFDIDQSKIEALKAGKTYIMHMGEDRVKEANASGRFSATADFDKLGEPDALMIAVPTPLTLQREPDMQYVVGTGEAIAKRLRRGQLVILESTTYPGTTDELLKDILERTGLKCGKDFFLAFSPEREDPGNKHFNTATIPKVVGGVDPDSGDLAAALYARGLEKVVRVRTARVAEATKLTENIFRGVNIALVNELKMVYERMGIDVWDVLDAAATKPFGFMKFTPGPGLGGHCIPLDPFYLTWKAREFGISTRFIELAGEVNVNMPRYVIEKLQEGLNEHRKSLKGSKVLVLGIAYKKDIDDPRESPSFELIHLLMERGAEVSYHDPHIPTAPGMRSWPHLPALKSQPLTPELLKSVDAVLISTEHTAVDYNLVLREARLVVDTRGVYRDPNPKVVKA